jgi:hypothetical protein
MTDQHIDRTKVSFAEAEAKSKLPAILTWGDLDPRLRSALWTPVYVFFDDNLQFNQFSDGPGHFLNPVANGMMLREFVKRRHRFINEYQTEFSRERFLAGWAEFFKKSDYVEIFDFLTFLIRDQDCPKDLVVRLAAALEQPFSPYRLSIKAKTIFPAVEEAEAKSLERDLDTAFSTPFSGSKTHLQSALQALGEGDYRATVRESIHSVESAIKDFTGDESATLSKAIKSLVGELGVHKALTDAFDKLYAYTSDEKGIRHALVFGDNEKVGFDEAIFFLSACTAFVGFLGRKKAGKGT